MLEATGERAGHKVKGVCLNSEVVNQRRLGGISVQSLQGSVRNIIRTNFPPTVPTKGIIPIAM